MLKLASIYPTGEKFEHYSIFSTLDFSPSLWFPSANDNMFTPKNTSESYKPIGCIILDFNVSVFRAVFINILPLCGVFPTPYLDTFLHE